MENKVTSLELSRRLDALIKDKKETEVYWVDIGDYRDKGSSWYKPCFVLVNNDTANARRLNNQGKDERYRAFLTDEILERLPFKIDCDWMMLSQDPTKECLWVVSYKDEIIKHKSLPEALGLMLEYVNSLKKEV